MNSCESRYICEHRKQKILFHFLTDMLKWLEENIRSQKGGLPQSVPLQGNLLNCGLPSGRSLKNPAVVMYITVIKRPTTILDKLVENQ